MQTNQNDHTFPVAYHDGEAIEYEQIGITKFEFFTAAALQGLLANPGISHSEAPKIAKRMALAIIKELNSEDSHA